MTIVIQFACVEYGGQSLRTVPLNFNEHMICLGLGCLPIFTAPVFKILIPASLFNSLSKNEKPVE